MMPWPSSTTPPDPITQKTFLSLAPPPLCIDLVALVASICASKPQTSHHAAPTIL